MNLEKLHTTMEDNRSPEQREADANTLAILREFGFLKQISIDNEAVLKALSEWQRTGNKAQLVEFFRSNSDKNVAKEFGTNGLEAMEIILEQIEEIKEAAKELKSGLKDRKQIFEKLKIKKAA